MTPQEELIALRRMKELEDKAGGGDLAMPDGGSATRAGKAQLGAAADYKKNLPTNGMNFAQTTAAGLGKMMMDTVHGVQQRAGYRTAAQVDEDRQIDEPLMRTAGGNLGYVGGQAAAMAIPLGSAGRVLGMAGKAAPYIASAGRSAAFAGTQPVGTGETLAGNMAEAGAAGVVGQGIAHGTGAAARGAVSRMEPVARGLAQKADQLGLHLGMGQISDNPLVRTAVSQMERLPFSGASARNRANQEAFNKQVGSTFGLPETKITPDKFAARKKELGTIFDQLSTRNTLRPDG